jgi:hypothetical protein
MMELMTMGTRISKIIRSKMQLECGMTLFGNSIEVNGAQIKCQFFDLSGSSCSKNLVRKKFNMSDAEHTKLAPIPSGIECLLQGVRPSLSNKKSSAAPCLWIK